MRYDNLFLSAFLFYFALSASSCNRFGNTGNIDLGNGYTVTETVNKRGGIIQFKDNQNEAYVIRKPYGHIGEQEVPAVLSKSRQYWESILKSDSDILGEEYLKDPHEPSFERTANLLPPKQFPHDYVGMREYPHELQIGWDGAIGMDPGFITGKETDEKAQPFAVAFSLNGKPVDKPESLSILRGQLDNYLPAIQYVYQRDSEKAGWEQIAFMGKYEQHSTFFVRFRLRNYSNRESVLTFSANSLFGEQFSNNKGQLKINVPYPPCVHSFKGVIDEEWEKFEATLIPSEPFILKEGVPQWRFKLAPQESKDLYIAIPGYSPAGSTEMAPQDISKGFFLALLEQKQDWEKFFNRGIQIDLPEQAVCDIYKSSLAKLMISVDGNEPRGGALYYEGFWAFVPLYFSELMLQLGYFDEAKRYLDYFIKNRIKTDGDFLFGPVGAHQTFDEGRFLSVLAMYYNYTHDESLILDNTHFIRRVLNGIEKNRQISKERYPVNHLKHGLMIGILNNDVRDEDVYYTTDAPVWAGLKRYSNTLLQIADKTDNKNLRAEAEVMSDDADEYHRLLRRSFETAIERDEKGNIIFIHPSPPPSGAIMPYMSPYRADDQGKNNKLVPHLRAQFRFHDRSRLIGSGFLNEEEIRSLYYYDRTWDKNILGVRRYLDSRLDDFQSHSCDFQMLKLGLVREYMMKYYAYLHYILMPGGVGLEQVHVLPDIGNYPGSRGIDKRILETSHYEGLDGAHATIPVCSLTRNLYVFDDPDQEAIWIARGIPTHWYEKDKTLTFKGLTSKFGKIDYESKYDPTKKQMTIEILLEKNRNIPLVYIGIRAPGGLKPVSVKFATDNRVEYNLDSLDNLLTIRDISGEIKFSVTYE
uniref:hypothetical protein n=1 Tax=uncultured Draconibacterium sp. TaxID=1573823 RepID=UPI003217418B